MGDAADDAERRAWREVEEEGEHSTELVPSGAPVTLFQTDDPVEIVARATQIANALSDVLKQKKLTTRIGQKDHVQVDGWSLCGTMLGVYPVVEWTRPVEGGWEARVEARTRDGAVVGAAEAECLRTENRWRTADDYAIRSMAQTRAISKALRAPLGFIVALAGYETTPEEEMVRDNPPAERPFNPDRDLLPGAITGQDAPTRISEALNAFDPTVDWQLTLAGLVKDGYGKPSWRELQGDEAQDFWRRLSNTVQWIDNNTPPGDFPPVSAEKIVQGLAFAFVQPPGNIELHYVESGDAVLTADEARRADAAEDDVPFGEPEESP